MDAVFVNRQKLELNGCETYVCGGGDVLGGAYRRTLKVEEAAQGSWGGKKGKSSQTKPNPPCI